MFDNPSYINEFIDGFFSYGTFAVYLLIFLACFIENIFPPFHGDTFILAAGSLIALGKLGIVESMLAVNLGGMSSIIALYLWGKSSGREFFKRKNYKFFTIEDIYKVEKLFQKRGVLILLFSRFVVGVRTIIVVVAGIGKMPFGKMVVFSLISYLMFSSLLMYLSYTLVENANLIASYFKNYNFILIPLILILILLFIYKKYKSIRKRKA